MATPNSSFFIPARRDDTFVFRSTSRLHQLLNLSQPYGKCLAYAPYAKNAPHCSRPINRAKQARVPALLDELRRSRIPSTQAGRILKELSRCAVCGITGWHQNKADEVYDGWVEKIWDEYFRASGLDPDLYGVRPSAFTSQLWLSELAEARAEIEGSGSESDSDDNSESEEELEVADYTNTTQGDASESDYVHVVASDASLSAASRSSAEHVQLSILPSVLLGRTRRIVPYRDPEPDPPAESSRGPRVTAMSSNTRKPLQPRDSNIPIPSAREAPGGERNPTPCPRATTNGSQSSDQSRAPSSSRRLPAARLSSTHTEVPPTTTVRTVRDSVEIAQGSSLSIDINYQESNESPSEEEHQQNAPAGETDQEDHAPPPPDLSNDVDGTEETFDAGLLSILGSFVESPERFGSRSASTHFSRNQFRPMTTQLGPVPLLKALLHEMTQTVSAESLDSGYIYAYTRPSQPGYLKIGYTSDKVVVLRPRPHPVDNRIAKWDAACGYPAIEVFRVWIPQAARRIETLIHKTLHEYRRVEHCVRCSSHRKRSDSGGPEASREVAHREWFDVDEQRAREVVEMWRLFSEQRPYDRFGRLDDFWSELIAEEKGSVRDGDSAATWLTLMPRRIAEHRRRLFREILGSLARL